MRLSGPFNKFDLHELVGGDFAERQTFGQEHGEVVAGPAPANRNLLQVGAARWVTKCSTSGGGLGVTETRLTKPVSKRMRLCLHLVTGSKQLPEQSSKIR